VPGAAVPGASPAPVPGAAPSAVPGAAPAGVDPTAAQSGAPAANVASASAPVGAGVDAAVGSGAGAGDPNFASPTAHTAFEAAKKELGVPYLYGGESPKAGFDCSGLMQWAYHQAGINLPRVADQQFTAGTPVGLNDLKEGDLVFFRIGGGDVDHVGMYVGNHQFLEAPRTGEVVQMADLRTPYWSSQFAGARRVVPLSGGGLAQSATSGGGAAGTTPVAGTAPAPAGTTPAVAGPTPAVAGTPTPAVAGTPTAGAVDPTTGAPSATPAAPAAPGAPATPVAPAGVPDPNAAPAVPGTAQFQAVAGKEHHYKLNTVKFLQAVQPAPGSPLAPAEPQGGAAPAAAGTPGAPVAGQPVVDQLQGQPGTGAPAGAPGAADQALSQAAPAGSVVSVSSSLLTSGQQTFVAHLSSLTGLNTRVVAGWVLAEESGSAAQGREASSNFNWLNIGYFDSGTGAIAHATPFSNPVSAAEQTAKFLKGQWGGASTGIQNILNTVGKPPDDQIMAIANSGWASSHYNNGANLRSTFEELANMKIVTAPPAGAALGAAAVPSPGGAPAAGGAPIPPPGTTIT
jgi:cell wall-associated NlpC family hydrolase